LPRFRGVRACVNSVCRFLVAAHVRGGRVAGSGTGRSPAARWAAPEASLRRLAVSPMMGGGKREPGFCAIWLCVQVRPVVKGLAGGSAAGCIHPFACPGGPGVHGAVRVKCRRSGGVNQDTAHATGCGGGAENRATSRLAAGQGKLFMTRRPTARRGRARSGSGSARRASRSRPESAAAARRRPWRCCGPGARAGR
jgi:hypothetical protein